MEIRKLRNFIVLAEELHFGRAAARLAMTQPPLSSSIQQLEEELGVRLFDRDKKSVRMTAAGKALYPEARQLLQGLTQAIETTTAVAGGATGEIRIGYSTSMLYRGLPKILDAYRAACPRVALVLHESHATDLVESLRHQNLDAAFVNMAFVPDGLQGHIFSREEFAYVLPVGHRLATASSIGMKQLADDDFVMFRREASPASFDNVMSVCRAGGIEPKVRYGASQWINMIALVGHGYGVSIVPRSLAGCGIANTVFVPVEEGLGWCAASFVWNAAHQRPTLPPLVEFARTLSPAALPS